jgi:hypothetical protein
MSTTCCTLELPRWALQPDTCLHREVYTECLETCQEESRLGPRALLSGPERGKTCAARDGSKISCDVCGGVEAVETEETDPDMPRNKKGVTTKHTTQQMNRGGVLGIGITKVDG